MPSIYPPGAIFCRTCGYCLHGLPTNVCPECGNAFDPADPATFLARPRRVWVKRTIFWTIALVLVLGIGYGGFLTWLYVGWRAEAGARALPTGPNDKLETRSILPSALSRVLPVGCRPWQERVDMLQVWARPVSSEDVRAIAACRHLRLLYLGHMPLKKEDVAALCRCSELEKLILVNAGLRSGDVAPLSALARLKTLALWGNRALGDADLASVAGLTELRDLALNETAITDSGLAHLAGLANMEGLCLTNCRNLTDAAVPYFTRLTKLKEISLAYTRLTPAGVAKVHVALPQCKIIYDPVMWPCPAPATGPASRP